MESTTEVLQKSAEESVEKMSTEVNGMVQMFQDNLPDIMHFGMRLLIALLIFMIGKFLIKWIRRRVKKSFLKSNADTGVVTFTDSFLKFGLYLLLILLTVANLGVELSSITVIFASAGVGISLSLQESLSNLAGGVLILMLKPFVVGDYIIEDTNKCEGTVKEIQIFYTKLTTVDNKTVVIPNGALANNSLTNVTAKAERQLDLRISISYHSDLKKAKQILEQMLDKTESVIQEEERNVFVDSLGDHAVVLGVRGWVKTEEYWPTRWKLLEEIKLTFEEEGIEIPYNQMTVHLREQ